MHQEHFATQLKILSYFQQYCMLRHIQKTLYVQEVKIDFRCVQIHNKLSLQAVAFHY